MRARLRVGVGEIRFLALTEWPQSHRLRGGRGGGPLCRRKGVCHSQAETGAGRTCRAELQCWGGAFPMALDTHMFTRSHARTFTCTTRTHAHVRTHTQLTHMHIHTRARVPTRVHTCTCLRTHSRAHTFICMHMHTHTPYPVTPSHQQGFLICHETESQAGSGSEWRVGGRRGGRGEWRRPPAGAERA